jgi:hypothetical protein
MNKNSSSKSRRRWWQWLLMYPGLLIAIIGAMPTFIELYDSHQWKVPFGFGKAADQQNEIWEKNFECTRKQAFREVITRHNVKVGTIVCPSGDVLFRVEAPDSPAVLRWVGLSTFRLDRGSSINLLVREAVAADLSDKDRLAQAPSVLCQRWLRKGVLLRRLRYPNGQCFDETIDTYRGIVISRVPAPCDSNC